MILRFDRQIWLILRSVAIVMALGFLAACQPGGSSDENPVFTLVRNNDAAGLQRYLAEGGDPDIISSDGDSLLYVASGAKGGIEVVVQLLLAGADTEQVSRQNRTPLHTAAAWCNERIVKALLDAGASATALNSEGKTPPEVVCAQPYERRDPVIALFQAAEATR